jgi:allantoin racemase
MKLLNLDPVAYATSPEEEAYISKYLSAGVELVSRCAEGVPETIESEYEEALAAPHVADACVQAEKDGFDGVFVDCFGDPGVRAARELVSIPVLGGFEPAILTAMGLADRFAIITVVPNVIPMIYSNAARAGITSRLVKIDCVDMPVVELKNKDRLLASLYDKGKAACFQNGAEAIVLGCTAMIDVADRLREKLKLDGLDIPVIEPAQAALATLETYAKMGLRHSRLTYPVPARIREQKR